jgi:predicted glycosyltransferase
MLDDLYNGFLVAPLNWGLGHASRCIPIIRYLVQKNIRVVIASDGDALAFLRQEFPLLPFVELPAYGVQYADDDRFAKKMVQQLPRFVEAIYREQEAIDEIVRKHMISKIISDNRYGCHHKDTQNYLITHQLKPKFNGALRYFSWVAEQLLRLQFSNFNEVWVPDMETIQLAGELAALPIADKRYIGLLSRLEIDAQAAESNYENELLIILSGVEPQRSILEKKILSQLTNLSIKAILVRGIEEELPCALIPANTTMYGRLTTTELSTLISKSKYVLCRAGYSSIMDLSVTGKKAILVPTPGQTEQEYLGEKLMKEKKYLMQTQVDLNMEAALLDVESYEGLRIDDQVRNKFKEIIDKITA